MLESTVGTVRERARVMLVDDHPLFREAMCHLLEREQRLDVVAEVGSAAEALPIVSSHSIHLAIVDLVLVRCSGVTLTQRIKQIRPECRVLVLSNHDSAPRIASAIRAGADGFAAKTQGASEILSAVRMVLGGATYLPPAIDARHVASLAAEHGSVLDRLTSREREIYELLVAGENNDAVAGRLFIARRTVETHRQNIMRKLEVTSIVQLVRLSFHLEA